MPHSHRPHVLGHTYTQQYSRLSNKNKNKGVIHTLLLSFIGSIALVGIAFVSAIVIGKVLL